MTQPVKPSPKGQEMLKALQQAVTAGDGEKAASGPICGDLERRTTGDGRWRGGARAFSGHS